LAVLQLCFGIAAIPSTQITDHPALSNVLPAMQQVEFCSKRCLDAVIGGEEA
jgi:hypothetical protein